MEQSKYRTENDLLGSREVPADAYYGVQTLRAMDNFHISGRRLSSYPRFIKGMAITKKAAAIANSEVGMIAREQGEATTLRRICNPTHIDIRICNPQNRTANPFFYPKDEVWQTANQNV